MSDAIAVYSLEWSSLRFGLNISDKDLDLEENLSFYSGGDRSRFAHIKYEGDITGHVFVTQKGTSVCAFVISGFLIDDPEIWHELFDGRIANLKRK